MTSSDGASRTACKKIRAVLAVRIEDLDRRIAEMRTFRSVLADHLRSCDRAIGVRAEADCPTIDAIARGNGPKEGRL